MPSVIPIILCAFLLDCLLGDPQNPAHPIRIIGGMISWCVRLFQQLRIRNPIIEFVFGMILTVVMVLGVYFATKWTVDYFRGVQPWLAFIIETILCYFIIAPRALRDESMKVYEFLKSDDISNARTSLSRIVGRDTHHLESPEIVRATVETVAENFSDGVIAPLFFVCLGGVPLGLAYKTINTLDSMIGYRNEKYEYLGKFAAVTDDIANYIPSRISALFLLLAALVTKTNPKHAFRVYRRDRRKHKSPNSAQTESVCAGALGLQLGGDGFYNGKIVSKPTIGDPMVLPLAVHIITINRLMYTATVVGILAMSACVFIFRAPWRLF